MQFLMFPENNQPLNSTENSIKFRMWYSIDSWEKAKLRIKELSESKKKCDELSNENNVKTNNLNAIKNF
jgi:DNA-directed RNA polymerase delta subunit